ncbi:hypothetical protein BST61_g3521 [Cercospora zeina]
MPASKGPLELPFTLSSNCGKHQVLLEKYLQIPNYKEAQVEEDDFYIAVFEGKYQGEIVVVKIYGSWPGYVGEYTCIRADREVKALRQLNEPSPCPHAPELRASFHASGHWCRGYSCAPDCHVIVMSKLPGRLDSLTRTFSMIQTSIAVWQQHFRRRSNNHSHHDGNVLWSEEENKCYIIDYERALFTWWEDSCFADWIGAHAPPYAESASKDTNESSRAAKIEELQGLRAEEVDEVAQG